MYLPSQKKCCKTITWHSKVRSKAMLAWEAGTFHVVKVGAHSGCSNGLIIALLLEGQPKQDVVSDRGIVDECRLRDISNLHISVQLLSVSL